MKMGPRGNQPLLPVSPSRNLELLTFFMGTSLKDELVLFFDFAYFGQGKGRFRLTRPDSGLLSLLGAHCIVMFVLDAELLKVVVAALQRPWSYFSMPFGEATRGNKTDSPRLSHAS